MQGGEGDWRPLGAVAPGALVAARAELHWAAQAVEQVGKALAPPVDDYRHIALRWNDASGDLVTEAIADGSRFGLRLARAKLVVIDRDGADADTLALVGRTLEEAAAWVRERAAARVDEEPGWAPLRREGLPAVPVGGGAPFGASTAAHTELASWYGNAAGVIERVASRAGDRGPALCWPHHFDLAVRIDFDPDVDPEEARSVGLGMSPGDERTPEPYFYVLPWPRPDPDDLPPLEGFGAWMKGDWVGGLLKGSELVGLAPAAQGGAVTAFLAGALEASRRVLGLD